MSKKGLHRHYDKLEPEERFRLDMLAMARGDIEESERLTRTCPKYTYTMNDRAYTGRWKATVEITLRACAALNADLAKLQMIEAFRVVIPYSRTLAHDATFDAYFDGHRSGSYHAWGRAGMTGHPPAWPKDAEPDDVDRDAAMERDMDDIEFKVTKYGELLPELMDRLEREIAAEALAVWEAFAEFCEEDMELVPEKMLKIVVEPLAGWIGERVEKLKELAQGGEVEANPEIFEAVREGFVESWRVACERGI
jgi:hypothetical protein